MCTSVQYHGNTGTIHVQYNPASNSLQWGVVMNSPLLMGGVWTFSEFVGDRKVNGPIVKSRDMLHSSVNPINIIHGAVFRVGVSYIDPFGFSHTNVPNACIIP